MVSKTASNLAGLPSTSLDYEIFTTTLNSFSYKTPVVAIDEHGEPQVSLAKNYHVHIKQITCTI